MNRKKLIKKVAKLMAKQEDLNYDDYKQQLKGSAEEIVDMVAKEIFKKLWDRDQSLEDDNLDRANAFLEAMCITASYVGRHD